MGRMVDRSGRVVDIPDEQMGVAFKSGKFGLAEGQALPVTADGTSTTGTVDAKEAAQALNTGARVATRAEVDQAETDARYGGLGGAIAAGAAGVARGIGESVFLPSDKVASDLGSIFGQSEYRKDAFGGPDRLMDGGERTAERLKAYQELHPGSSMVGEGLGLLGGAFLTGGAGLSSAGSLTESVLGKGLAGSVGRNAVEGGILGAVGAVNESALGDPNVTAEKVLAGVGHGALIGGGLGGLFHVGGAAIGGVRDGAGRFLQRVRPGDVDALAERTFGTAAKGIGEAVKRDADGLHGLYAKAASAASGADVDSIAKFTDLSAAGKEARRIAVYDAPMVQDEAARALRTYGDEMLRADKLITAEAKGSLKADYVRKAILTGNEAETVGMARNKLAEVLDGADMMLRNPEGVGFAKSVESVSKSAYRTQQAIAEAVESGVDVNAKTFIAMDQLKRDVQTLTRNGYRGVNAVADPIDRALAQKSVSWLDTTSADVRRSLEDEGLWGKAATDQRTINEAWSKQIDASKRFHSNLTTEVGRDPSNPYVQMRGVDPGKAESYVRGLTDPNKDLTHQAVRDYVSSSRELADAISKSYELPAEKLAEVATLKKAAEAFEQHVGKAGDALLLANQFQAMKGAGGETAGMLGAIGLAGGGPIGGLIGGLAGAVLNPSRTVAQLAAIERIAGKVDARLNTKIADLFSGAPSKSLESNSVNMLGGAGGDTRSVFESSVKQVRELSNDPAGLAARLSKAVAPIADVAPQIAQRLVTKAAEMTRFLAERAPSGMLPDPNSLQPHLQPPAYSDTEMRSWARSAAAMHDPLSVLDNVKRGSVSPEEVEVLKTFYPATYEAARQQITSHAAGQPQAMSRQMRLTLGNLFEVPTDIDLSPDMVGWLQDLHTAMPLVPQSDGTQPGTRAKAMHVDLAGSSATESQRREQR